MADLNINKSEGPRLWEDVSSNMIPNSGFESAPSFTAATNINQRWIDGTAAGSTTDDSHKWGIATLSGTASAQFDTSDFHSGAISMKLSTLAISSSLAVDITRQLNTNIVPNANNVNGFGLPVNASTAYVVTYWMKINVNSGSSRGAYVRVAEFSNIGGAGTTHDGTFVSATTGWTQYTVSFTTASTCAYLSFQLTLSGTVAPATLIADAWFDDIVLKTNPDHNNISLLLGPQVTPGIQDISGPKIWG
jgi:hypothetical protein